MRDAPLGVIKAVPLIAASLICLAIIAIIGLDVVFSAKDDFLLTVPPDNAPTQPTAPDGCLRMPDGLLVCDSSV